jgi:hypothetical protein
MFVRHLRQGNIGHHLAAPINYTIDDPVGEEADPEPQLDVLNVDPVEPVLSTERPEGDLSDVEADDDDGELPEDWDEDRDEVEGGQERGSEDGDLDERDFGAEDGEDTELGL